MFYPPLLWCFFRVAGNAFRLGVTNLKVFTFWGSYREEFPWMFSSGFAVDYSVANVIPCIKCEDVVWSRTTGGISSIMNFLKFVYLV